MSYSTAITVLSDRAEKHASLWRGIWIALPLLLLAYAWVGLAAPLLELPVVSPTAFVFLGLLIAGVTWAQANLGTYTAEMVRYLGHGDARDIEVALAIRRFRDMRVLGLVSIGFAAIAAAASPYAWLPAVFLGFATAVREVWWLLARR